MNTLKDFFSESLVVLANNENELSRFNRKLVVLQIPAQPAITGTLIVEKTSRRLSMRFLLPPLSGPVVSGSYLTQDAVDLLIAANPEPHLTLPLPALLPDEQPANQPVPATGERWEFELWAGYWREVRILDRRQGLDGDWTFAFEYLRLGKPRVITATPLGFRPLAHP